MNSFNYNRIFVRIFASAPREGFAKCYAIPVRMLKSSFFGHKMILHLMSTRRNTSKRIHRDEYKCIRREKCKLAISLSKCIITYAKRKMCSNWILQCMLRFVCSFLRMINARSVRFFNEKQLLRKLNMETSLADVIFSFRIHLYCLNRRKIR